MTRHHSRIGIVNANLGTVLTLAVLSLVGLTALVIYLPWLYTSRKNLDSAISGYNQGLINGVNQELDRTFGGVIATNKLIEQLISQNFVDIYEPSGLANLYVNILKANPRYKWVSFGFPNGDLLTVERDDAKTFRVVKTTWSNTLGQPMPQASILADRQTLAETYAGKAAGWNPDRPGTTRLEETVQINDADGTLAKLAANQSETYFFAPIRPWYQAALAAQGEHTWSDLYPFFTSKEIGIDASVALQQNENAVGVISISFVLDEISKSLKTQFAEQIGISRGGGIIVFTPAGELVASTSSESLVLTENPVEPALMPLDKATDPSIRIAANALKENGLDYDQIQGLVHFNYRDKSTQETYHVFFQPGGYHDWIIGTIMPESIFAKNIDRSQQILLAVVTGLMLAAALAALLLSRRTILQPMQSIAKAAEAVQDGNYSQVNLADVAVRRDELGQLATMLQYMADEVAKREKNLQQQVQALTIEIDQTKRKQEVQEIVETDFFQDLQAKADRLRQASSKKDPAVDE